MEIDPNFKLGSLRPDASPAGLRNWRVGEVLSAVATSAARSGSANLRIGGQTYQAQVPFTVRAGDRMLLEVIRTGTTPLLRPVGAERSPDPVQAALRTALPRQAGLPPLLANLAQLATARGTALPAPQVVDAARKLFQRLATERQIGTADGLRRAVHDAGTQLEAKLARAASGRPPVSPIGDDFKAGLLRLREAAAQALRLPPQQGAAETARAPEVRTMPLAAPANQAGAPTPDTRPHAASTAATHPSTPAPNPAVRIVPPLLPPLGETQPQAQARAAPFPSTLEPTKLLQGLLQQVESSLARLQLSQLASQHADGEQRQVWLLELPVRRDQAIDVLHLRIQRQDERGDGLSRRGQAGWTVQLAFDLDGLGPVQARIGLHSGQVSTAFWTERESTTELFRRHLDELRAQLEAAGLEVAGMSCQAGQPQRAEPGAGAARNILDEQA